jgi:hypothetical protein
MLTTIYTFIRKSQYIANFRWPCGSFRDFLKSGVALPIPAHELAANCSAPFVTCTVKYDLKGG